MSLDALFVPYGRLDPGNPVARDHARSALALLGPDYRDPRALRPLLDAHRKRERPRLGELLAAYNDDVGGSAENARALDDSFCVVSGQQVGLLLGPAYTTWKLFATIHAARRLQEELGTRVIPVFWIESEDHDWDEVNRFFVGEKKFSLDAAAPPGTPIAEIEADPEAFLSAVRAEIDGDEAAWRLVEPERRVARWHVRNLARLVAGSGVVFLEPAILREPMRAFAARIAAEPEILDRSLDRPTGYEPRLVRPEGGYLFDAAGPRRRIARRDPLPERWSCDVASRVVIQNAALPALTAVCGPSEVHYWAQLRVAHEELGVPFPAVLPRSGATLVERKVARDASKLGLDLEAVVRGETRPPEAGAGDPVAARLRALAGEALELESAAAAGSLDLPPATDKPFRRTVSRLREDLERLAERMDDARLDAEGVGKRRYEAVLDALRPRGRLQERTQSLFLFLARHGPALAEEVSGLFASLEPGHYLVRL